MLINGIVYGVAKAIRKEFGESIFIYVDSVEQGLKEPCFFINTLSTSSKKALDNRYIFETNLVIQYISDDKNDSLNSVGLRLFSSLEIIKVKDILVRGSDLSYQAQEGVLNFNVTYEAWAFEEKELVNMEELKREVVL